MRLPLLVVVTTAIGLAPLSAQNPFERQVRDQLDKVGQNLASQGFELTTQVYIGELEDERNEEVSVRLRAGVRYAIVGVCDEDCDDLDVVLYNANGREIAADVETDDVPVVEVTPDREGTYIARAVMANCNNSPCAFGLGLFSASVDPFDRQVREQLERARQRLGRDGFTLTHQIYTGELRQNQEEDVTVMLDAGRTYLVVGVCDEDCKDLDLRLLNAAREEVDRDVERDDYPAVAVSVSRDERYTVRGIMAACSHAPCRFGFGVFAR